MAHPIPLSGSVADRGAGGSDFTFEVHVHLEQDVARVGPVGEIDIATVGAVRKQIDELTGAGFGRLILDLREVGFLDSTGLHLAVHVDEAPLSDGFSFVIIDGPPAVQRAFDVARLRDALRFVDAGNDWWQS